MDATVDILAVGVHPDDVELSCSGTLLAQMERGYTCAILDLTKGELGTRGDQFTRAKEAEKAAVCLGITRRYQAGLPDGFFTVDESSIKAIIPYLRHLKPKIVLANAPSDRHPDHGRSSKLVEEAVYYSGLSKIETFWEGEKQEVWRPQSLFFYIQDQYLSPDVVVDITPYFPKKKEAVQCYETQFYNPNSSEPETPISQKNFLDSIYAKNAVFGRSIGVDYAEGFICSRTPGVKDLFYLY